MSAVGPPRYAYAAAPSPAQADPGEFATASPRAAGSKAIPIAPALLAALVTIFLAAQVAYGRFPHADEIGYKGPGRELVASGRYVLPEFTGFEVTPPFTKTYGLQLAYGLLTAGVIAAFGLSATSMLLMDASIHGALAFLTWALCRRLFPRHGPWIAAAAGAAVLPLGTIGRADELGMLLALGGLVLLAPAPAGRGRVALAGGLIGLSASAHPQCAVFLGAVAIGFVAFQPPRRAPLPRDGGAPLVTDAGRIPGWRPAILLAGAILATASLLALAQVLANPDGWRQLLDISRYYVRMGALEGLARSWRYSRWELLMSLGFGLFAASDHGLWKSDRRRWCALWLAPIAVLAAWLVAMPERHFYLWYTGPWMLAAGAGRAWESAQRIRRPWRAAALAGCVAIGMIPAVRAAVVLISLPAEQGLRSNARIVRETIPPGSGVVTDAFWSTLAGDRTVYSASFAKPPPGAVDFVILTGNGSGAPGRKIWPPAVEDARDRFELIHDNLNREPLRILGVRLTNSAYGFGTAIYRRKRLARR